MTPGEISKIPRKKIPGNYNDPWKLLNSLFKKNHLLKSFMKYTGRVHTGPGKPGKPGKGVNFLKSQGKSQGKSPGNFENSKKVLEKVLGNIFLVLKKNYSILFSYIHRNYGLTVT